MFLESSLLLSGLTTSPGDLLIPGEITFGITFSLGQLILLPQLLSGSSVCVGNSSSLDVSIPPNIFKLLFGDNAIQTSTQLIINKDDLPLTPQNNNTAESLLVGIISRLLISNRKIITPKIDYEYWGYGYSGDKRIDTILIKLRNLLSTTNIYEIADYDNTVNPNNY